MPNTFFLLRAGFNESCNEIELEFGNGFERKKARFEFFPSFLVSLKGKEREVFDSLLSVFHPNNLMIQRTNPANIRISSSSFTELKKFHSFLVSSLKLQSIFLEPERQFLLEKNWTYFGAFRFSSQKPIKLLNPVPLHKNLVQSHWKKTALSGLLYIPLDRVLLEEFFVMERFLENLFFLNGFCPAGSQASFQEFFEESPKIFVESVNEINLAEMWPSLLCFPFYNIGPDSINCRCCKPRTPFDENISPASMAKLKFLVDGFYFESAFPEWAELFHKEHESKAERERKKKDWGIALHPVGPFFRQQEALVPLIDALELIEQGKAKFIAFSELRWFCRKKESFVSMEVTQLNKQLTGASALLQSIEKKSIQRKGVLFSASIKKNLMHSFLLEKKRVVSEILQLLPFHLSNPSSSLYVPGVGESIKCVQRSVLKKFLEFLSENGAKHVFSSAKKSFIQADSPLLLVKEFSRKQRLPALKIIS